jgi:hypothetical protein
MANEHNAPNIVPFGKYKGQPVEVLAQDRPYLEWLSAQDWFRERYAGIYTLIINNFTEATETPDHNALQVLFLDDAFCQRFATVLKPQWRNECMQRFADNVGKIVQIKKIEAELFEWKLFCSREFEVNGVDVDLNMSIDTVDEALSHARFNWAHEVVARVPVLYARIEIKPAVGDDYPAVLRQMRANKSGVLFTQNYIGVGATEEQFVKTFVLSDIKVVFRRDVDAVQLVGKPNGWMTLQCRAGRMPA